MSEILNGGYVPVDCKGVTIPSQTGESVTIIGIYERLKEAEKTSKAVLVFNYFVNDLPSSPVYAALVSAGSQLGLLFNGGNFVVTNDDNITKTN